MFQTIQNGGDVKSLENTRDSYTPNFGEEEISFDKARRTVFKFEKNLTTEKDKCPNLVEKKDILEMTTDESMVLGGCILTLKEDGMYYQSGIDLAGGNVPTPTLKAYGISCEVYDHRLMYASDIKVLATFDDGMIIYYLDTSVPFQTSKLFEAVPVSEGHTIYGHAHALRFIISNRRILKTMYNGKEISVVCQEMGDGKYAVPHVLMLEQKYRSAFNIENVSKDYDDSVKIEMIGFSRIWSVFWAHCHIAILQRIPCEPEPEPEPSSFEKEWEQIKPTIPELDEVKGSLCSMVKSLCEGYSPPDDSDDDELGAPLMRTISRRE